MKRFFAMLLALLTLAGTAQAVSTVRYEGGAEAFVFLPGSEFSETDLFKRFKQVVPGDVITQRITVRNSSRGGVRIYLRAEPTDESSRALLERLNLQVSAADGQIFDAAASQTGQLTENTLLGTFKRGGNTDLLLTLTVPYDLDNTFAGAQGVVAWTFLVEEVPGLDDDTPHTGDDFRLSDWLLIAGGLCGAIALVSLRIKRKKAAAP